MSIKFHTVRGKVLSEKKSKQVIVIMGLPGSGKGTQSALLAKNIGAKHLSTGFELRWHVAQGTEIGKQVAPLLAAGLYVPSEFITQTVNEAILKSDNIILDGYPRDVEQANDLFRFLNQHSLSLTAVIFIDIPEAMVLQRVLDRIESRSDDDKVPVRIKEYNTKTLPVIDYYETMTKLKRVDGTGSIEDIETRIYDVVRALA